MNNQVSAILDRAGRPMQRSSMGVMTGGAMALDSSYKGASTRSRHIGGWSARLESANAGILRDGPQVRARARDIVKNDPLGAQAARIIVQSVCGNRLRLALMPNYNMLGISYDEAAAWARIFEGLWESYAHGPDHEIDAGRRLNFTRLMKLLVRARYVDGEGLAVLEYDPSRMINTCIRLVDIDRLSNPLGQPDEPQFRGGIELDDFGAPVTYHIRERHPSDDVALITDAGAYNHRPVNRKTGWGRSIVLHYFEDGQAEQIRGISAFAPVIQSMKMGRDYAVAELANAHAQSKIIAQMVTDLNYSDAKKVLGGGFGQGVMERGPDVAEQAMAHSAAMREYHDKNPVYFDGEEVLVMPVGTSMKLESGGHPSTQYSNFQNHSTKENAAGLGVDSASFSQNYADTSYSAARGSLAHNWRHYESIRQEAIDDVAFPWLHAFAEEVIVKGIMPLPGKFKPGDFYEIKNFLLKGKFVTAGKPMIDPNKERQGQEKGLAMVATTLEEIAAADGKDAGDIIEQRAREMNDLEEKGLLTLEQQQARAGIYQPAPEEQNGQ